MRKKLYPLIKFGNKNSSARNAMNQRAMRLNYRGWCGQKESGNYQQMSDGHLFRVYIGAFGIPVNTK